ncbi:MAG: response regulator [Elusimicrobia bacterium]|nr:response regulator [Elusimicrobiota bacterium]
MAKVLIIDDDTTIIELLAVKLRAAGHKVVAALDGMSGSMVATNERPDLIVLDYSMPAANGAKVRERLRGCTFTATTPIIVLTASPLAQVASEMGDDPLLRLMQKPVNFTRFAALAAELLGGGMPSPPPAPVSDYAESEILDLDV